MWWEFASGRRFRGGCCAKAAEQNATGRTVSEVNETSRRIRGRKTPANSHHATLSLTQQVGTPDPSLRGDLVKPVADLLGNTESHMHRRTHIRVQVGPAGEVFTGLEADELGASLR